MRSHISRTILAFFLCIALAGCAPGGDNNPGEKAQVPAYAETITFAAGGAWGPVIFPHLQHADEYYDGVCLFCHDHESVGEETHWSCGECHTSGIDAEDLCDEYTDHGCIMTQCQNCHLAEGPPAPDGSACGHCHQFPGYAEIITFPAGEGWKPVPFAHEQHAVEYYDGECVVCHDHDEGRWSCQHCHTSGTDPEDLCDEYADHGCIMTQCQDCHLAEGPPAPDGSACGHCHQFPDYAEIITFQFDCDYVSCGCHGAPPCPGTVTFTHQQHALEYHEGKCLNCHMYLESYWICTNCHSRFDTEGRCVQETHHGCIETQCRSCHSGDPCSKCHA